MEQPKAALISIQDHRAVARDELDDWYDTEHIPQRLAIPGFLRAERWSSDDGAPVSLALYDLADIGVLTSDGYKAVTGEHLSPWSKRILGKCVRTRWDAELTMHLTKPGDQVAQGLLLVAMNVEDAIADDFDAWYRQEHLPSLFALPGVIDARRYRAVVGKQKHLAVYHLEHPDVQASAAWKRAIDTPWASRVRPRTMDRARYVFRRYERAAPTQRT